MRTRRAGLIITVAIAFGALSVLLPAAPAAPAAAAPTTTAFVSLPTPQRLLDTRTATRVEAGATVTINVTGAPGLPAAGPTRAAVLNVTITGPAGVGYWTVYPGTGSPPNASNLNVDERWSLLGPALAMPNLVTVRVAADGTVSIFSSAGGDVIVDMLGSYQDAAASAAGRLVPLAAPQRIFDTRSFFPLGADSTTRIRVPGANGASAALLNVTVIGSGAGYWTAFPAGQSPPNTANLNTVGLFHTVANQVIVPLDANGDFDVYAAAGGHLIVDLVGTFTGDTAPSATDGLFVPLGSPTRVLDTRVGALNPLGGDRMPEPSWNLEVAVAANPVFGGASVSAVSMNITLADALSTGYVTVSPAGSNNQAVKSRSTSTLNIVRAAQTLPNHATVAVSSRGFDVFTQSGGNLIADVSGYYLGAPVTASFGKPANTSAVPVFCPGFPTAPVAEVIFGSSKATVARAQQRLLELGFWLSAADGSYGLTTSQAVMAFQKWSGLTRSGNLDEATATALNRAQCRPGPTAAGPSDMFLVDKGRQLGFVVRGSKTVWVVNVSTGGNYAYTAIDQKNGSKISDTAVTPTGSFRVYRVADEPAYEGSLGTLYRPRFFSGGVAVHGYRSVPNYPASHGCVRVSNAAMDMLWGINAMPMRSTVVVID
ncbi:MAG: L,D-transpeptidase family protein [Ilumatobacteraceae bacterium]